LPYSQHVFDSETEGDKNLDTPMILESLTEPRGPSGPRYLFIVSRNNPGLYEYLRRHFVDAREVEVMFDRRRGQRRRSRMAINPDRRSGDRRTRSEVDDRLRRESHVFLTLT
jgi:hypothetical protein